MKGLNMTQSVFSFVDHEVFAITAHHDGKRTASIATWVLPSSIQPGYPECMILSSPHNFTHELMLSSGRFVLHLLAKEQAKHLLALGIESGRNTDKLGSVAHTVNNTKDIILDGVVGYRVCTITKTFQLAERVAVVGKLEQEQLYPEKKALSKKYAFSALSPEERQSLQDKQKQVAEKSLKS